MHLNIRLSQLLATVLSAFALMFSSAPVSAEDGATIGTLTFSKNCTVLVNGRKQPSGYAVHAGDAIKTGACKAYIRLGDGYGYGGKTVVAQGDIDDEGSAGSRGGVIIIDPATRVRVYLQGNSVIAAILIGGVHYFPHLRPGFDENPAIVDGSSSNVDPLPFLAAFGFGNFSFPSIGGGGGGAGATSNRLPIYNSTGALVGYALTNSAGEVIAYTDPSGVVLAVTAPNGTPVSSVFGPGSVI